MIPQGIQNVDLDQAARRSDELIAAIKQRDGDLTPAFDALEKSLHKFEESGYPLDAIVPATSEGALGFSSIRETNGRRFWEKYSGVVKKDLCDANGELHKLVKSGLAGASGAVVSAIVTSLSPSGCTARGCSDRSHTCHQGS